MKLHDMLVQFGLTEKEARIYLAILELGEALPQNIAKKSGLKRSTLYNIFPGLIKKGLISQATKGKRRIFIAENPLKFFKIQQEKLEQFQSQLPQLLMIHNRDEEKPKVSFYEGIEGVKQVYEDTLKEKQDLYAFLNVSKIRSDAQEYLLNDYVPRRVKAGVYAYNLISGQPFDESRFIPEEGMLRENRFVSEDLFPADFEILIYGDKVAIATWHVGGPMMGIIIDSQAVATSMFSLWKLAWQGADGLK